MIPSTLQGIAILILSAFVYRVLSLFRYIRAARKTGIPFTLTPVHELELWAHLTNAIFRAIYQKHVLKHGQGWPRWARFMIKDWMFEDKYLTHQELGETFLVVSPGGIICYSANPELAVSICTKRRAFIKPPGKMKMLEPFGPNIVSVDGNAWKLHYRVTAPALGDRINEEVWNDTQRQTEWLKKSWSKSGIDALKNDVYSLGVNVMAHTGFGISQQPTAKQTPPTGHHLTMTECLCSVVANLPWILLLPRWALKRFANSGFTAHQEFSSYAKELIRREPYELSPTAASRSPGSLLEAMVCNNTEEKASSPVGAPSLTDNEVLGNIFIYFMAGYDTTANTIIFSCVMMALHPELQEEAALEVKRIAELSKIEGREKMSYQDDFSRFKYLLAFMYETLRVFPIVLALARVTAAGLEVSLPDEKAGQTAHSVPGGTNFVVNVTGIHYNESCWIKPAIFEPKRWLAVEPNLYDPSGSRTASEIDPEARIPNHSRGTFMTFGEGSRACIGRRFALAEYVSFWAELLQSHTILLAPGADRDEVERTFKRLGAGSPISLQPPVNVRLQLKRR